MVKEDPINPFQNRLLKIDAEYGGDCPPEAPSLMNTRYAAGFGTDVFPPSIRRRAWSRLATHKKSLARSIANPPGQWIQQEFPEHFYLQLSPNPRRYLYAL